jgi:hypothetical protein
LGGAKAYNVTKSSEVKPETLVTSMASVFILGLMCIIGLMAVMKFVFNERGDMGLIIAFASMSFMIMLLVEGVLGWMLLRGRKSSKGVRDTQPFEERRVKEPDPAKGRLLPEPLLSVTDHTTRTLEPSVSRDETE